MEPIHYHGLTNAWLIHNGEVEAVVVPSIGRVMQFRWVGREGPFWENRPLDGQSVQPETRQWINFGGDKTWPAPQSAWPEFTGRGWPPPSTFDSMAVSVIATNGLLSFKTELDSHYGIEAIRTLRLLPGASSMEIVTTYRKREGEAIDAAVWIITQLDHPIAVFAPIPSGSQYADGYHVMSDVQPAGLMVRDQLLSLTRDPAASNKIGLDGEKLLWVGAKQMLLIESRRIQEAEYPDNGSSTEIYTNPDPLSYVELETLSPLQHMRTGDVLHQTNFYRLLPRFSADPVSDARRVLFGE